MKIPSWLKMVTYMGNLNRYNPFPTPVWFLFIVIFIAGYFTGGFIQSKAIENDTKLTVNYLRGK